MTNIFEGAIFKRSDSGYEAARQKTVWHKGVPERYPQVIVQAKNESDVIAAVQLARKEGLKIALRSGGHSWSASHLRDNSLLIDLSEFKTVVINKETMTATAQPGIKGSELAETLRKEGLYFPIGHCDGVCLGGYLLQGGFAWRGREFGPSCMSVIGIDVVTAEGKMLYADEKQHSDLFWAARGAGPGFFGIVTCFHLKLYPLQKVTLSSYYIYPPAVWEDFLRWSHAIQPSLPPEVELWNLMYRDDSLSTEGPVISVSATAFVDSEQQGKEALAVFENCPMRSLALTANVNFVTTTSELTAVNTKIHYPKDKRFIADNMWTHASFDALLPGLKAIHKNFPPAPSHMVWFPWKTAPRPSMSYSLEDVLYLAIYAAWDNPADDKIYKDWVTEHMRAMEKIATGIQLADENLINRPQHFMSNENLSRLDKIRNRYDPDELFVSWLGRPHPPQGNPDKEPPNFMKDHPFEIVKYPLPKNILIEQVMIPMRDGICLAATVFRPKDGPPVPVITTATPYGKDRYDQWDAFRDHPLGSVPGGGFYLGKLTLSDHTAFESPDPGFWVPNGYAVVLVDLPGRGKSESNPSSTPGPEARWWDTMAWLEAQPWCIGNVGMSGVSALCATQWIAAQDKAPPQLKAIIPWEGINETGPGGGYGGIPETAFVDWMESYWLKPNYNTKANGPEPYIKDWHFDIASIKVPALICASFSDQELHTWDTFEAFTRIKSEHKWLYNHRRQKWGAYYGKNELALQKRFFDRFLKGDLQAMDDVPSIRLEVNKNRFDYKVIQANSWPVEGTQYKKLYLNAANNQLIQQLPATPASFIFAPEPVLSEANRAFFDFKFDKDTDVVGHMAVKLFVEAIKTDDVDLFIGIEKLDASGNKIYFFSASGGNANGPVSRGWLRTSMRALDKERSTPWRPVLSFKNKQLLSPNEIVEVDIALMPSGTTFLAGETLRLIVQSWSVPGEWEGGECREWNTHKVGQCRIHTGNQFPAYLLIPIL